MLLRWAFLAPLNSATSFFHRSSLLLPTATSLVQMAEEPPAPRRSTRVRKPRTPAHDSPEPQPRKRARRTSAKSDARTTRKQKSSKTKQVSNNDEQASSKAELIPDNAEQKEDKGVDEQKAEVKDKTTDQKAKGDTVLNEAKPISTTTATTNNEGNTKDELNADEQAARKERPWGVLTAKDKLKVVTWNVASLRAISKAKRFLPYIEKERPDLLCLQETKMTEDVAKDFPDVEGYTTYWNHSQKKGYSGVAILVNEKLEERTGLQVREVKKGMGLEEADHEGRILTCYFGDFVVVNAYVPNAGGKLARLGFRTEEFEPAMRSFLNKLRDSHRVIYCGDLNVAHEEIDIHNSKANQKSAGYTPQERAEFSKFLAEGWKDTFRERYPEARGFTYYSRRFGDRLKREGKGWRLDYHVVDEPSLERVNDMYVRDDVEGSDHLPVVLEYKL